MGFMGGFTGRTPFFAVAALTGLAMNMPQAPGICTINYARIGNLQSALQRIIGL
jgi:hypothetical protein